MSLYFRKIQVEDAAILLKWRTDPEITKHMYTDLIEPSVKKQEQWIRSVSQQQDFVAFVMLDDNIPVGYVCFNNIDFTHRRCNMGSYIYDKQARTKYAATLSTYLCNYAFEFLQLNKIENYVLEANAKVVKLQKLQKSKEVGRLSEHVYKNGEFHDVVIFETLKKDWIKYKQHFTLSHIKAAFDGWV